MDFDIEHRSDAYDAPFACGALVARIIDGLQTAHKDHLHISVAPQVRNLDPFSHASVGPNGANELLPLVAGALPAIDALHVQCYNDPGRSGVDYSEKYVQKMAAGFSNGNLTLTVPPAKLVLGYPASAAAAAQGFVEPAQLVAMWARLSGMGFAMGALMTWSIGWDHANGWAFATAVSNAPTAPTPAPTPPTPAPTPTPPPTPAPAAKYSCEWTTSPPSCKLDPGGWASQEQCKNVCHEAVRFA